MRTRHARQAVPAIVCCAIVGFAGLAGVTAMAGMPGQAARDAGEYHAPRLTAGGVPVPPANSVGWIEATLDVTVDASGAVADILAVRATPGALDLVQPVVAGWTFQPAVRGRDAVAAHVLVAMVIRPPQIYDAAIGQPAVNLASPSPEAPVATRIARPVYPPRGVGDRTVLVEAQLAADGSLEEATVFDGASDFYDAALAAARASAFGPARVDGVAVPSAAYLIFGFRTPTVL
jgi:hypothetical protein